MGLLPGSGGSGPTMTTKTTTCCGAERNTPFCPMCGKSLANSVGHEILRYMTIQVNKFTREAKGREAADPERYGSLDRYKRRLAASWRTVEKWTAWRDWVASALDTKNTDNND